MFNQTLLFVLGGCLLGAIQLLAGIGIGMWLRRSGPNRARRERQDMNRAGEIARRLHQLAEDMSTSVGEHRHQLDQASQLLSSEAGDDESLATVVVEVIGDIVRANHNLQSKLETAESRLVEQAAEIEAHICRSLTDTLTGLPNRRQFNERLEERMSAWRRRGEPFALLLVDVDFFKKLNDEHGHPVGDQVLVKTGRALRGAVRREDLVARYGGEEFAILLPNTKLGQAVQVAENVRTAMASLGVAHAGTELVVTLSGGVAAMRKGEHEDALIQRADAALYAAKAAGRNRTFLHDGAKCRPANEQGISNLPSDDHSLPGPDLLDADDAAAELAEEPASTSPHPFGSFLEHEAVSRELAQTCAELRQFMHERGQTECDPAAARQP